MADQLYVATYKCGCLAGASVRYCDWVENWERDRDLIVRQMTDKEFHATKWIFKDARCPHDDEPEGR